MNKNLNDIFSSNTEKMHIYEKALEIGVPSIKEYLSFKGYDDDIINRFHIGYVPDEDKNNLLAGRLIYPWIDIDGNVLGFCGRCLNTKRKGIFQKFILSEGLRGYIDYEIYGLYQAAKSIKKENLVYVVNGYTDVLSWSQKGLSNVVSCSGSSLTETQVRLLRNLTDNVILICETTSENACCAAFISQRVLTDNGLNALVMALPDYLDAEEFSNSRSLEDMKECIKSNILTREQIVDAGYGRYENN